MRPASLVLALALAAACDTSTPPPAPDPIPSATSTVDPPDTLRSEGGTVRYTGAETGVLTYATAGCTTLDDSLVTLTSPDPASDPGSDHGRSVPVLTVSISGSDVAVSLAVGPGYESEGEDIALVRRTGDTFVVVLDALGLDATDAVDDEGEQVVVDGLVACGRIVHEFGPTPAPPCVRRPLTCRS